MTEKQLKRLSRRELLEMLVTQTRRVEALEAQLKEANAKLEDRHIQIQDAGNLADAVMKLNKVFEAAQAAADQYLLGLQSMEQKRGEDADEA